MGQLRSQTLLGTSAVYRIVSVDGDRATLEVVEAPGLEPGYRLRVLRAVAEAMEIVPSTDR